MHAQWKGTAKVPARAIVAGLICLFAAASAGGETLRANRGGLMPTVRGGLEDEQTLGPAGLTVDDTSVFVADPLASRAIEFDKALRPLRAWPFAIAPHDLLRLASGQLCAIDAAAERLECRASATAAGPSIARRLRRGAMALVRGPADAVWALRGDGFTGPAWGADALVHAMPLGIGPSWQAAGLWRGRDRVEVQMWPWRVRPDDKGVEPSRTLAFAAPTGWQAGSVRPLRMDAQGRIYVAVEWLAGARQLQVLTEVVRIDGAGLRSAIGWPAATYAPALQDLEVDANGGVWRLYHSPGRVHVDAFSADAWRAVTR